MTTKSLKPVRRETSAYVREKGFRPLVVTIVGSVVLLRPKGLRSEEVLDLAAAWSMAVKQRVLRQRAERKAARRKK